MLLVVGLTAETIPAAAAWAWAIVVTVVLDRHVLNGWC